MKELAIGLVNLKMMMRERSNIFFVFIFPLALVLLIGVQFGGGFSPVLGVYQPDQDSLSSEIVSALEDTEAIDVRPYESREELVSAVERGVVQAGVLLDVAMDADVAAGEPVEIGMLTRPDGSGNQLQSVVGAAISEVMTPVGAAQFASRETGVGFEEALAVARELSGQTETISPNRT